MARCSRQHAVRQTLPLAALLTAFLATAVVYSLVVPLWEAPDEPEHFQYVRYLVQQHALPTQLPTILTNGNNEAKQPPLYYLLATPFVAGIDLSDALNIRINPHAGWAGAPDGTAVAMHELDEGWPYHGVFLAGHRARLLSVLLGTLTVFLTYGIAANATSSRRMGLFAAGLAACLPGFLFASAAISNDTQADTLAAALVFVALRTTPATDRRQAALFGTLSALALLTKLTTAPAIGIGAIILWNRSGTERHVRRVLVAALPVLAALLFWVWRVAQGERQVLGKQAAWPPAWPGSAGPPDWSVPLLFLHNFWHTFFGVFSWGSIPLPAPLYVIYSVLFGIGLFFAVPAILPRRCDPFGQGTGTLFWLWSAMQLASMAVAAALVVGSRVGYDHSRLFYPALPAVCTLVAYGWSRVATLQPRLRAAAPVVIALAAVVAAVIPFRVIRPVYAPPWRVSDRPPATAARVLDARFLDSVTLVGVQFPSGPLTAGSGIYVWFYWLVQRPMPDGVWLFVHVVDDQGRTAAAFDGVPASDTLPPRYWLPGDVIYEREVLTLHSDAQSGSYAVKMGWYNPKSGVRVPVVAGGTEVRAGTLQVVAAASPRSARRAVP